MIVFFFQGSKRKTIRIQNITYTTNVGDSLVAEESQDFRGFFAVHLYFIANKLNRGIRMYAASYGSLNNKRSRVSDGLRRKCVFGYSTRM